MKRIKAMNGYTIAQATKRDEPRYTAGEFAVYFSADVRDYGFLNSYPEFEGCGTLAEAVENIAGSNYGKAVEIVNRRYTVIDWEEVEAVAAALDRGAEFNEDGEEIAEDTTTETKGEETMNQNTQTTAATLETMREECAAINDFTSYRQFRREWSARREAFETAKRNHQNPADTVAELVEALGYDTARALVASVVHSVGEWDGRISDKAKAWADTTPGALARDAMKEMFFYTSVHSCHVDQIAREMMNTPEPAPVEEEPEEENADPAEVLRVIRAEVEAERTRSAWERGVKEYALELVESLAELVEGGYFDPSDLVAPRMVEKAFLNGAGDWSQYSWGGCSLIYNEDIASRLCCPSELKKTRNGERRPNAREEWLDTQARALFQAARIAKDATVRVARWFE